MLSDYFLVKTKTLKFQKDLDKLLNNLAGKKVVIYGAGEGFSYLLEKYPFKKLKIVAIADKKFSEETKYEKFKAIPPEQIFYQDYDFILVTNEQSKSIFKYISKTLKIDAKKIKLIFNEDIPEERDAFFYIEQFNFAEHLEKLNKKLKNKKIIIYGAGIFFEAIKELYDLSQLDIIGISDRRFLEHKKGETFLGYTVYSPDEIKDVNPDYVLVATKFYINIIENLYYETLKGTKIKIKPLLKKPFKVLFKEIWG